MSKNLDKDGLSSIVDNYQLFYIDLWGVVHNGVTLHQEAIKALKEISKKVTEEAGETSIAAVTNDGRIVEESADLLFHLIVLLKSQEHSLNDVMVELEKRNTNQ